MGTLYVAVPSDERMRNWFQELGLPIADPVDGRLPTEEEIWEVLRRLRGYTVEYYEEATEWVAEISSLPDPTRGPWTSFAFPKSAEHALEKPWLTFRAGWPEVMVQVLHRLAQTAGPIALIPDTGGDPLLVYAAADPEALLRTWDE